MNEIEKQKWDQLSHRINNLEQQVERTIQHLERAIEILGEFTERIESLERATQKVPHSEMRF